MFQFKNVNFLPNNRSSILQTDSNLDESLNKVQFKSLQIQFHKIAQMQEYFQIPTIITEIRKYIKFDNKNDIDFLFLEDIYQILIQTKLEPFITQISDLITHLILMNNEIGYFFISKGIILFFTSLISINIKFINSFFPLIRVLIHLEKQICDDILKAIPAHAFKLGFQNPALMIESGLFFNNISKYEQSVKVQKWIFESLKMLFNLKYFNSFVYLAKCLYRLSKKTNFDIISFEQANLMQFIIYLLEKPQLGCVMLVYNFFSKLFDKNQIQKIPEEMTKYVFKYSVNFEKPQRCIASINLLRKMIKFGFFRVNQINKVKIMKIYLQILTKEEISFPIKEAISYIITESFIYDKYTDNEVDEMITSGLLNVFEFSFVLLNDDLLNSLYQVLHVLFNTYEKNNHQQKFIDEIKKSSILDIIQHEYLSNESILQFYAFFSSNFFI